MGNLPFRRSTPSAEKEGNGPGNGSVPCSFFWEGNELADREISRSPLFEGFILFCWAPRHLDLITKLPSSPTYRLRDVRTRNCSMDLHEISWRRSVFFYSCQTRSERKPHKYRRRQDYRGGTNAIELNKSRP